MICFCSEMICFCSELICFCSEMTHGSKLRSTCILLSQTPIAKMALRFATIVFASCILQIAGPPASAWIFPCDGAPKTRKITKNNAKAPLLDQLLQTLNQVGCTKIGSLARASLEPVTPALRSFAAAVGGANSERSLHNWAQQQSWIDFLPEPFDFKIHIEDLGGNRAGVFAQGAVPKESLHSALLPHEVMHTLYKHAPDVFAHLLGDTDTPKAFWQAAATADDEWYREHPVLTSGAPPEVCIPIGLHGDDAGVHGDEQVLVITWNSLTYTPAASCLRC